MICKWYKGKNYVSQRWQSASRKIYEDIKSIDHQKSAGEHIEEIEGFYIHPNTGLVMAGKVIDYLLSVADVQAQLPERNIPANIRARDDLHWFSVNTEYKVVDFEFLVLARG